MTRLTEPRARWGYEIGVISESASGVDCEGFMRCHSIYQPRILVRANELDDSEVFVAPKDLSLREREANRVLRKLLY